MAESTIFGFFKESKVYILPDTKVLAVIEVYGKFMRTPHRKTRKDPLTKEKKEENQQLMSQRVVIENVILKDLKLSLSK